MKKALRLVFSALILGSLAVNQLPSTGNCQMMTGAFLAKNCPLPCCKTNMPMPKCPFIKASAPRDLISSSVLTFEGVLQPIQTGGFTALPTPHPITTLVMGFIETLQYLVAGPAQAVRAPPKDIHLLAA